MEIIGWISSCCFICAYLPQIYRIRRLQNVDNISVWLLLLLATAHMAGLLYAESLQNTIWSINHGLGAFLVCILLLQWIKYYDPRKDEIRRTVNNVLKEFRK